METTKNSILAAEERKPTQPEVMLECKCVYSFTQLNNIFGCESRFRVLPLQDSCVCRERGIERVARRRSVACMLSDLVSTLECNLEIYITKV